MNNQITALLFVSLALLMQCVLIAANRRNVAMPRWVNKIVHCTVFSAMLMCNVELSVLTIVCTALVILGAWLGYSAQRW